MREDDDRIPPNDLLQIHTIEIAKLIRHVRSLPQPHPQNSLEQWGQFVYNPGDPELKGDEMSDPAIKDAIKRLEDLSSDDDMREVARLRENALLRYNTAIQDALVRGEENGLARA